VKLLILRTFPPNSNCNDEIKVNLERMRHEREAHEDALAIVRQFNARLSAKKAAWFWPTVGAALASKHHWLIIACDACRSALRSTMLGVPLQRSRSDADHRPLAASVGLRTRSRLWIGSGPVFCKKVRPHRPTRAGID
jgi:hypothetical protein